jgi:nucleotide-binding universal stress UspA family protein
MPNILIPTDFSDNANKAISYAISLFGTDSNYTLVNGFEVPHSGATMLISIADILEKDALQLLNDTRENLISGIPSLNGKLDVRAVMGTPDVAIRKLLATGDFDVLVMGTKGATGVKEVLIGSVAANVIGEVKIPVIAVPADTEVESPKRILFAVDDQCLTEGKLPEALQTLATDMDAEVMIVNVVPNGEGAHAGSSKEQQGRGSGAFEGVKHSIHFIESNDVNQGIEDFIQENDVNMVAMVTRKQDLFSRLFGRSNTKAMAMHKHIPLFAFH